MTEIEQKLREVAARSIFAMICRKDPVFLNRHGCWECVPCGITGYQGDMIHELVHADACAWGRAIAATHPHIEAIVQHLAVFAMATVTFHDPEWCSGGELTCVMCGRRGATTDTVAHAEICPWKLATRDRANRRDGDGMDRKYNKPEQK